MKPVNVKKVRRFLKRQHRELIAVKRKHVAAAVLASRPHRADLSKRIDDWSNNGKFNAGKSPSAKAWAVATSLALGGIVRGAIEYASSNAAQLAVDHLQQLSDFAAETFGDVEPLDVDEDAVEFDDAGRLDELQSKYIGNARFGALATLMKVASAVVAGMAVADFADSIGADSSDSDDIAEKMFSPVNSRTETYIRTESGSAYGAAMTDASGSDGLQKRWATIDPGCEEICHPTDGQIVDMDDSFIMGDDSECDYPPAHPRCDCVWLPWKEVWGNTQSTDGIEEAA